MAGTPIIVITDAGALGRALAALYVARGWRVGIFHIDCMSAHAESLMAELGEERVLTAVIELTVRESWDAALRKIRERFGADPDHAVLVCDEWRGGGLMYAGGWNDEDVYRKSMAINQEAVYRALRALLPVLVEAGRGSVVITGSRFGERPWSATGAAAYAAAKAGAIALAQTAAEEVRAHGVRVNVVMLTAMDEAESRAGLPGFDASQWVTPASVAEVIAFLTSELARDVTGALIPMYGRT